MLYLGLGTPALAQSFGGPLTTFFFFAAVLDARMGKTCFDLCRRRFRGGPPLDVGSPTAFAVTMGLHYVFL